MNHEQDSAAVKDSLAVFQTSHGIELRGNLLRFTRHLVVIEIYNPSAVLQTSELLSDFRIICNDEVLYSGRATVRNVVNAGTIVVCEASLEDCWIDVEFDGAAVDTLEAQFDVFLSEWQKLYRVLPEYKVVIADLQSFLTEVRLWLEQIELGIRSSPSGDRSVLERKVIERLKKPLSIAIDSFIDKFEAIAASLSDDLKPVHRSYLRRQLHPFLLCSPFAYRSYHKPLGYAGDYEIIEMMIRPPYEGSTLFAKLINVWLLGQAPALAHRNRVNYLRQKLFEEALRAKVSGRVARVYNLGCGPAAELQYFLREQPLCEQMTFDLFDFNEETLAHARTTLEGIKRHHARSTAIRYTKRSVQQILKEAGKSMPLNPDQQYDLMYCAGLFDYLSDTVCKRLMNIFYDHLAPGGLLLVTNVSDIMNQTRPFRNSVDYILDWHLMYRDGPRLLGLVPSLASPENCKVVAEETSVNMFLEVRRPNHA